VLAVPGTVSPLHRALLAFDGSAKAEEALFIATYMAGRWCIPLTVITVKESNGATSQALAHAKEYLSEHRVEATFVEENGEVAEAILKTAQTQQSDLIIMGGYGHSPVVEVMLGSTVDEVVRSSHQPVLICR
jgi:nucleotide-binding universal stress UspA family protein